MAHSTKSILDLIEKVQNILDDTTGKNVFPFVRQPYLVTLSKSRQNNKKYCCLYDTTAREPYLYKYIYHHRHLNYGMDVPTLQLVLRPILTVT